MRYIVGQDGKRIFLFDAEEAKLTADTMRGNSIALLVESLLRIKALEEYFERNAEDLEAMRRYNEETTKCAEVYKKCFGAFKLELGDLASLKEVSQKELITAYNAKDDESISDLVLSLAK